MRLVTLRFQNNAAATTDAHTTIAISVADTAATSAAAFRVIPVPLGADCQRGRRAVMQRRMRRQMRQVRRQLR